ncbi:arsenate reductase [Bacteriovorax sp. BAL6_X]|uniref:arsenate reductase ArsC n=1 Tax=Bacteriovorax sp. BAL6_X TaxID=1201290 RepID=UPI0003858E6B|nr:arsenate reductase ArsC [Bacteriovorax sp. BAL6_X]EPZ52470.1 arsenate reductase [Bacteriovorax sp. BAL6_X]
MKKNILFLCTGNSCRSQMAEGWGKALKGDKYNFYSAGTKKHGLNPYAIKVMKEVGVDISTHTSNTTDELDVKMDIVITVCSDANENCPYFPGGKIIHIGFDDPPRLTKDLSDEEEILKVYRRVRDEIKETILTLEERI